MRGIKNSVFRAGLSTLYYSRAHKMLAPIWQGVGAIFMLHHVRPGPVDSHEPRFAPNAILEITPEYLESVILRVRALGLDIISLDEVHERLRSGNTGNRFVCFTFDDGYLDNMEVAFPVLEAHGCPMTVYVATSFPDGTAELWWLALEQVIAGTDCLEVEIGGKTLSIPCRSVEEKNACWDTLYWPLRDMGEARQRAWVRALAAEHGIDMVAICREYAMSWDQIRAFGQEPLVTIGAHTVNHLALAKLEPRQMRGEIIRSRDEITRQTGSVPDHFCYPYGDEGSAAAREFDAVASAGFKTAVTTRKGLLYPGHESHLTALPRVSLNGDYQSLHYLDVFLSGVPFALWNRFRKVDAA